MLVLYVTFLASAALHELFEEHTICPVHGDVVHSHSGESHSHSAADHNHKIELTSKKSTGTFITLAAASGERDDEDLHCTLAEHLEAKFRLSHVFETSAVPFQSVLFFVTSNSILTTKYPLYMISPSQSPPTAV